MVKDGKIDFTDVGMPDDVIRYISSVIILACSFAWYVGMSIQYVLEDLTRIPVRVELASEFRYRNPIFLPTQPVIVISQSGETADSPEALSLVKKKRHQNTCNCQCCRFVYCS